MRFSPLPFAVMSLVLFSLNLTACSTLGYQSDSQQETKRYEIVLKSELEKKFNTAGPSIIIYPVKSSVVYNSLRIPYRLQQYEIAYYAKSEWVDTPGKMLMPILVGSMENSGLFQSVVNTSSVVMTDLALDAELLDLIHVYSDATSNIEFSLRLQLIDLNKRKILATETIQFVEPAASNDPFGAVVSVNKIGKKLVDAAQEFVKNNL